MPQDAPRPLQSDIPSSFDGNEDFYKEGWTAKLGRRLKEEPLIPIGCAITCYALYGASRAMRQGKSYEVNQYFRLRVYAQGATLACVVFGGWYYKDVRLERKALQKEFAEREAQAKREKWLKELEARDLEDKEWRERHQAVEQRAREAVDQLKSTRKEESSRSASEEVEAEVEKKGGWLNLWRRS